MRNSAVRNRASQLSAAHEMPAVASTVAPILIFAVAMFLVYQVNHHTQVHELITAHEDTHKDIHFATGGREAQEAQPAVAQHLQSEPKADGAKIIETDSETAATLTTAKPVDTCHAEPGAEYHGAVVQGGDKHTTETAGECCEACQKRAETEGCNVWVWCGAEFCGGGDVRRPRGECWLKKGDLSALMDYGVGKGHTGITWISGLLYTEEQMQAYQVVKTKAVQAEVQRLHDLRERQDLPLVWMDVSLKGEPLGRMEFVLFTDTSPLAAENMRRMCSGEVSPKHTLAGAPFYRIIDQFIDQNGIPDGVSVAVGGTYKDDAAGLKLTHDRKGLLSMANSGPNTNGNHFSIMMGPAPHLNTHYTIFGEMVSGWNVAKEVNKLSQGRPNNELLNSKDAMIVAVGQLRAGTPVPPDVIAAGLVHH